MTELAAACRGVPMELADVLEAQFISSHQLDVLAWEHEVGESLLIEAYIPSYNNVGACLLKW